MGTDDDMAPRDRYHAVYLVSVLFGTAMLFPYNAFIATPPYVTHYYKYANGNQYYNTSMPNVWKNIENYQMVCSLVPNFLGQIALMTPWGRAMPLFPRFFGSLVVMIFCVLAIILVPLLHVNEHAALATLLGSTVVVNLASAMFQASMFSFAAFFPFMITQGVMLGIGVSGSLASILACIIKGSMGKTFADEQQQAQIYFSLAAGTLFLSLVALFSLRKNHYAKHFVTEWQPDENFEEFVDDGSPIKAESVTSPSAQSPLLKTPMLLSKPTDVIKKVWPMIFSVYWVFNITLIVFPSFGVKLQPEGDGWFGLIIILMFNTGDFSGRFLCRFHRLIIHNRKVVIGGSIARTIIVLLFFLCIEPRVIESVAFAYIIMYLTGVTNGYFGSHCMMLAPSSPGIVTDGDRGVTGNAMSVGLLAGAASGSLIALSFVPSLGQPSTYN